MTPSERDPILKFLATMREKEAEDFAKLRADPTPEAARQLLNTLGSLQKIAESLVRNESPHPQRTLF